MKFLVCLATLLVAASAKNCPSLSVVDDFNITDFSGTWYKQYGLNTPWEIGSCAKVTYTYDEDTEVLDVAASLKTVLGGTEVIPGSAVLANSSSTEGKLELTMNTYVGDITTPMWILATDYDSFAIAYNCYSISLQWLTFPFESVWVLTRDQALTVDSALLIEAAMRTIDSEGGPSMGALTAVSQKDC